MTKNVNTSIFWNNKYINDDYKWDVGYVTPLFVNIEKKLKRKSCILFPGCGLGHDALYFASKNHYVDALDFSEYAINHLIKKSQEANIEVKTIQCDFFSLDSYYFNKYDYIIEYTFFCAIDPTRRLQYVQKCYQLLKKGGMLKGIFLPLDINTCNNPPYQVTINDIEEIFCDFFDIIVIETNINSIPRRLKNEFYIEMIKK